MYCKFFINYKKQFKLHIGLDFVFSEHFKCEEFGLTSAQYKKKCEAEHPYYHVLKWRRIVKYDKPYDVLSKPVRGSRYSTHEEVTVLNQLMTEWLIKQHPGYDAIFGDNSELIMEFFINYKKQFKLHKKNIGKKYDDTKDIKEFYLKMEDKK